jgi:hypothetical protein
VLSVRPEPVGAFVMRQAAVVGRTQDRLAAVAVVLVLVTTASTFLPWAGSGERWRTGYEVVEVADRAGVLPAGLAGVAPLWNLVPALAGAIVLAAALGRRLAHGALTTTMGVLVTIGSVAVRRSPLDTAAAVEVALVLGVVTALSGAAVAVTAREETGHERSTR